MQSGRVEESENQARGSYERQPKAALLGALRMECPRRCSGRASAGLGRREREHRRCWPGTAAQQGQRSEGSGRAKPR